MIDESLNDLAKRLKLISDIRQQVNLIHNLYENKRILGKSNFKKVHSNNKGKSSTGFIMLGNGMDYIPPVDSLKSAHSIRRRASSIIQDYDSRLLPDVIRKPFDFFPHNKYDFVGKRQPFVRTATGQSTAVVPYTAPFIDKFAADNEIHGPTIPDEYYGPTKNGATGYEAHYTAERLNREKQERKENRYRYARLQASRRKDERERLYAKAPWMKSLVQSGIIDKEFIPKIAKGVDKLSGMKLSGNRVLGAVAPLDTILREYNKARRSHLEARSEQQAIGDSAVFGASGVYSKLGFGLGMDEIGSVKSFQRIQAKFGPATMEVLKAYGESMKDAPGWVRQNLAGEWGLSADDANIAMFLGGGKKFTKEHAYNALKVGRAKHIRDLKSSGILGAYYAEMYDKIPVAGPVAEMLMQSDSEMSKIQESANRVINESRDEASQSSPISSNTNIDGDNNVSSNINTPINITVYGNADPQEIASVTAESVNRVIGRRANMDNISSGVMA